MKTRANGDVERGIEGEREILGREDVGIGGDERKRTDVRVGLPAAGMFPAERSPFGFDPVDDALEQVQLHGGG